MKRSTGPHAPGERYLLQFPGGFERIAEATDGGSGNGEPVLVPVALEEPLLGRVLPGGEWLIERDERLVRDWAGVYWSVSAREAWEKPRTGPVPMACEVVFERRTPQGEQVAYRARSPRWPAELSDAELGTLLRQAWETMRTDEAERRRRSNGVAPSAVEL
jgi:hypothetical protein